MDKTDIYAHSINRLGELMKQYFFSLLGLILSNIILLTSTYQYFRSALVRDTMKEGGRLSQPPGHTTAKHPLKKT
jgi:hypothetical protein